mgnify:FL=1
MKAAADLKYSKLAIAGGVSANSLLRKNLNDICKKRNIELYIPTKNLCGDNAAMVASQAYYEYINKNVADFRLNAFANMSIETLNFY